MTILYLTTDEEKAESVELSAECYRAAIGAFQIAVDLQRREFPGAERYVEESFQALMATIQSTHLVIYQTPNSAYTRDVNQVPGPA